MDRGSRPVTAILDQVSSVYEYLDHPGPIPFAHRGGSLDGRENSMAAFERAVDLGYRYLETDVRATSDGVLLAFHDAGLERVTGQDGLISRLPYATVARARMAGDEPVPRLDDILGAWPDARLNIDIKADDAVEPLMEVLRRTGAWHRVCVTSFSSRRLRGARARMRALAGRDVCTALGPQGVAALRALAFGGPLARRSGSFAAACAQVPYRLGRATVITRAFVDTAHELGLPVHAWTINDAAAMEHLLDIGADGIITDDIDTLREVLKARGQWAT